MTGVQPSPQQMDEIMGKWFVWINKLAQFAKYNSLIFY